MLPSCGSRKHLVIYWHIYIPGSVHVLITAGVFDRQFYSGRLLRRFVAYLVPVMSSGVLIMSPLVICYSSRVTPRLSRVRTFVFNKPTKIIIPVAVSRGRHQMRDPSNVLDMSLVSILCRSVS